MVLSLLKHLFCLNITLEQEKSRLIAHVSSVGVARAGIREFSSRPLGWGGPWLGRPRGTKNLDLEATGLEALGLES